MRQALLAMFTDSELPAEEFAVSIWPRCELFADGVMARISTAEELRRFPYDDDDYVIAEPSFFTLAALAAAAGRRDRITPEDLRWIEDRILVVQQSLEPFHPIGNGGWNMMANQIDPTETRCLYIGLGPASRFSSSKGQLCRGLKVCGEADPIASRRPRRGS